MSVQLPTPPGRCPKGHFLLASPGIARVSAQAAVSEEAGSRQARGGLRATRAWTSTRGAGAYRAYRPMHGLLQEAGEQADLEASTDDFSPPGACNALRASARPASWLTRHACPMRVCRVGGRAPADCW